MAFLDASGLATFFSFFALAAFGLTLHGLCMGIGTAGSTAGMDAWPYMAMLSSASLACSASELYPEPSL